MKWNCFFCASTYTMTTMSSIAHHQSFTTSRGEISAKWQLNPAHVNNTSNDQPTSLPFPGIHCGVVIIIWGRNMTWHSTRTLTELVKKHCPLVTSTRHILHIYHDIAAGNISMGSGGDTRNSQPVGIKPQMMLLLLFLRWWRATVILKNMFQLLKTRSEPFTN